MANNYLEFSEILAQLGSEEEKWLREQFEVINAFGDQEYAQDALPEGLAAEDADWIGCRAYRDMADYDRDDGEGVGFVCELHDDHDSPDSWGRHLWVHTEEWGHVDRVAHLVQKFLKAFRPD